MQRASVVPTSSQRRSKGPERAATISRRQFALGWEATNIESTLQGNDRRSSSKSGREEIRAILPANNQQIVHAEDLAAIPRTNGFTSMQVIGEGSFSSTLLRLQNVDVVWFATAKPTSSEPMQSFPKRISPCFPLRIICLFCGRHSDHFKRKCCRFSMSRSEYSCSA